MNKGACIYCGQTRLIDIEAIEKAQNNEYAVQMIKDLEIDIADYVATKNCSCDKGKRIAKIQDRYYAACNNVEYILSDAVKLIPLGKAGVKSIIDNNADKVTISFGDTVIKISRGKKEIKVEKTITTKESLES